MRLRILCGVILGSLACSSFLVPGKSLRITHPKTQSGENYTFFHQDQFKMSFEITRPSKADTNILLCIAGAFTTLDNNAIDGFYMKNGTPYNEQKISRGVGGALVIKNGIAEIVPTEKGKLFTKGHIENLTKTKASCFQQIMIIEKGKAAGFKDQAVFQRRAIVTSKDGKTWIAESSKPMTLQKFSQDLVELGAWNALYTDMGGWDEGWYRDEKNKTVTIGQILTSTLRQTNWVTLQRKTRTK